MASLNGKVSTAGSCCRRFDDSASSSRTVRYSSRVVDEVTVNTRNVRHQGATAPSTAVYYANENPQAVATKSRSSAGCCRRYDDDTQPGVDTRTSRTVISHTTASRTARGDTNGALSAEQRTRDTVVANSQTITRTEVQPQETTVTTTETTTREAAPQETTVTTTTTREAAPQETTVTTTETTTREAAPQETTVTTTAVTETAPEARTETDTVTERLVPAQKKEGGGCCSCGSSKTDSKTTRTDVYQDGARQTTVTTTETTTREAAPQETTVTTTETTTREVSSQDAAAPVQSTGEVSSAVRRTTATRTSTSQPSSVGRRHTAETGSPAAHTRSPAAHTRSPAAHTRSPTAMRATSEAHGATTAPHRKSNTSVSSAATPAEPSVEQRTSSVPSAAAAAAATPAAEPSMEQRKSDLLRAMQSYDEGTRVRMSATSQDEVMLRASQAKPFIGVSIGESKTVRVVADAVYEGSPAYAVGMRPGDEIVTLGGIVIDCLSDVRRAIKETCRCGSTVLVQLRKSPSDPVYDAMLFLMTSDPDHAGQPYYFDVSQHKKVERRKSLGSHR